MPIASLVTVSRWASPSMSGQYSSSDGASGGGEVRTVNAHLALPQIPQNSRRLTAEFVWIIISASAWAIKPS